nr:hypothetical protein BaRGS_020832 [Batillaria attramentaria]
MWREAEQRRHQGSYRLPSRGKGRKRPHARQDSENNPGPSSAKKGALDEEELRKARAKMQEAYRLQEEKEKQAQYKKKRTAYETNYQTVLTDESGLVLGFRDIPWPSKGSIESVMDVLFCDLGIKCKTALKKYVKQQQVRWHPDKFLQKFGERIEEQSKDKVLERVKQISQAINKRAETILTDGHQ